MDDAEYLRRIRNFEEDIRVRAQWYEQSTNKWLHDYLDVKRSSGEIIRAEQLRASLKCAEGGAGYLWEQYQDSSNFLFVLSGVLATFPSRFEEDVEGQMFFDFYEQPKD